MKAKYSIVVPVYNEEQTIPIFYKAITKTMRELDEPYEVIFVNDGSKDKTAAIVKKLAEIDKSIKLISFSRNFGQQAAIFCGFSYAVGDAVVCMDVDLQDPVEVVPQMIAKWKEGYEIVHGRRTVRKGENWFKKITSKIYLFFLKKITKLDIPANVGEFKLLDRKVVDTLKNMPEQDRYLRGISAWVGYKQCFVDFERKERVAGATKYSLPKLVKLAWRSVVSMSTFPLSFAAIAGVAFSLISTAGFTTFIILAINKIYLPLAAWLFPTITCCFAFLFSIMGFNNIYIKRIYQEVQNRPRYIVAERINIEE